MIRAKFHLRGVLDSASQNNFITEAAIQRLKIRIRRQKQNTRICGFGGNENCNNQGQIHLLIRPSHIGLKSRITSVL